MFESGSTDRRAIAAAASRCRQRWRRRYRCLMSAEAGRRLIRCRPPDSLLFEPVDAMPC